MTNKLKLPSWKIVLPLTVVVGVLWLFRESIREEIRDRTTLANEAPPPEVVSDMIEQSADPQAALLKTWNSGKIIQREVAIDELRRIFPPQRSLPSRFHSLLLSATFDPDMDVRELAFASLQTRKDPDLTRLAALQLRDADPQSRFMGLRYLKHAPASVGAPLAAALLDDPDLRVAGLSTKLLENWSGKSFGVKLVDTVQVEDKVTGLEEFSADGLVKTKIAAGKARVWWVQHQSEYPPPRFEVPAETSAAQPSLITDDFQLRTIDGRPIRLSDYRGKVVLINFWTTWCTACMSEIPELVALQSNHPDNLVVLGVSLDLVPDEDGDIGGDDNGQKFDPKDPKAIELLQKIRDKVIRTVRSRDINYTVTIDELDNVGNRFNGGELPTTVIVDADGKLRRRFVGARSLPVFESMIAEASHTASQGP